VDIDHGQLIGRRLEDVAIVVDLDELAPVGGRAAPAAGPRRLPMFPMASAVTPFRSR